MSRGQVLGARVVVSGRSVGVQPIRAVTVGATRANFAVPSGIDTAAGTALISARDDLLSEYANSGTPYLHSRVADPATLAFQRAWNADPAVVAAGASAQLDAEGAYGQNTHDAVAAINGGLAPDLNTNAPAGTPTPNTPASPSSSSSSSSASMMAGMPSWGLWLVGAAAVGGAYLVGKAAMEKHGPRVAGHARRAHAALRHHARRLSRRH